MKNLINITIIAIFLSTGLGLAQGNKITEGASGNPSGNTTVNLPGGVLNAAEVIKLDNKSHWIKKGKFVNRNNTVTIDFSEKLYVNNVAVIEQVDAKNGYIVFFSEGFDYALVYLADEKGNLNSDELYINLK
jgi:hypothetical protein